MDRECEATLQYLASAENTIYYASQAGDSEAATHTGQFVSQRVSIANARSKNLSIDREGFQIHRHSSNVQDYHNDEELKSVYNYEIEDLLKSVTGANRVVVFDHTRRASSAKLRTELKVREPSSVIHNDYTSKSALKRLKDIMGDDAPQGRCSIVNVWRSIAGTVRTSHLAFCDFTSLDPSDLVAVKRVAKDRIGELQMALYNPSHKWYYFPEMNPNEVAVFKTFDSALEGTCRFTIHTAFDDPNAPADAEPRQSLETRAFLFY